MSQSRQNWYGLRRPNNYTTINRNCSILIYIQKNKKDFPCEIMIIINDFLNWVPAGCWTMGCLYCKFRFVNYSVSRICSWDCLEKIYRKEIMEEYDTFTQYIQMYYKSKMIICITNLR